MSKKRVTVNDGYQPKTVKRGYQPSKPASSPANEPKPQSGYIPTTNKDRPSGKPKPPGNE